MVITTTKLKQNEMSNQTKSQEKLKSEYTEYGECEMMKNLLTQKNETEFFSVDCGLSLFYGPIGGVWI